MRDFRSESELRRLFFVRLFGEPLSSPLNGDPPSATIREGECEVFGLASSSNAPSTGGLEFELEFGLIGLGFLP